MDMNTCKGTITCNLEGYSHRNDRNEVLSDFPVSKATPECKKKRTLTFATPIATPIINQKASNTKESELNNEHKIHSMKWIKEKDEKDEVNAACNVFLSRFSFDEQDES